MKKQFMNKKLSFWHSFRMNKKGVTVTAERLIFIILAIAAGVVVLFLIFRMAPSLFDSLKDMF